MPKIRNITGEAREWPWFGRTVADGEVVDVPDSLIADLYLHPSLYEVVEDPKSSK